MSAQKTNVQLEQGLLKKLKLLKIATDSKSINDTIALLLQRYESNFVLKVDNENFNL
jgi:hypothetical protein